MSELIRTTHVGSLPRSQRAVDLIFARERGESFDRAVFESTMAEEVEATVERQVASGIDVVSDGETSKIGYATYVKDRYTGFGGDSPRNAPADLKQFPAYLERIARSGGTPKISRPCCIDEVRLRDHADLEADIRHFQAAIDKHQTPVGFMNAASPGVVALFLPNRYYSNYETYLAALSDAFRYEYQAITDAGLLLQIDCPDLALARHMIFTDKSDEEFVRTASMHVEALNAALDGIPEDRIRVHICWGNYEGPHVCDIDMDKVFPVLMKTRSRYLLFESSNPRHAHEWTVFKARKSEIPDDKILVPGVIDSTTNFVEHPELIRQRIERFVGIVGKDRVMAGSDCGFGTFAGFGTVDPDIVYEKLCSLAEGARRV
ncbi:Methionine synthase II (Cobalamin-independent) [hydrothermal vent metagenome]|jgi:5-methyltetrahydropteroyltriglutamate--homocysteine methyltransferase|uniref:Methionine synthase II (Cobalamin-independent) n=1 Tax=hydrothermal vent metagenome TaxID=652676 RepID=A0A160TPR2_9ZZZZ|tara:strand:- start:1727 stop:2851 length:1125 start_codon:yes stop_codon:yes gene_type:complete